MLPGRTSPRRAAARQHPATRPWGDRRLGPDGSALPAQRPAQVRMGRCLPRTVRRSPAGHHPIITRNGARAETRRRAGDSRSLGEVILADASADDPDVLRLGSLLALRDVELDLLPLLEAAAAAPGDRAD